MLAGAEFSRRLLTKLQQDIDIKTAELLLSKNWDDFCDRRGQVRALKRALDDAHDIIRQIEG